MRARPNTPATALTAVKSLTNAAKKIGGTAAKRRQAMAGKFTRVESTEDMLLAKVMHSRGYVETRLSAGKNTMKLRTKDAKGAQ
eukprot:CAMPEP_0171841490 /NCGR_PEP_ID=MMETSP0992-20121227/14608_1 /TAXON_ID=483369 /ORGANISM="non described non described, Strain CCMP2098" /LENGTH=83 /DNA_ID=CAMNT_0012458511 /DNA_START=557 /DNA_END=808 /DNA_ORIENTATION=-